MKISFSLKKEGYSCSIDVIPLDMESIRPY